MIIWLASYPKSGNTWVRLFLDSLLNSDDNNVDINNIKIRQFPLRYDFDGLNADIDNVQEFVSNCILSQDKINLNNSIKIFKTHNAFWKAGDYAFTNQKNTKGVIHIIRDPRNVITSLKNHYELSYDKAYDFITNEKKYIYDQHKLNDYSDFQFIGSWKTNFQSWKYQKEIPIKFIKYENLLNETFTTALGVVEFVNKILKNKKSVDKKKLENVVNSTSFERLKKEETIEGFSEAIISRQKDKKIPFFYLGPKNDWKKILDKKIQNQLNTVFMKNLKELLY